MEKLDIIIIIIATVLCDFPKQSNYISSDSVFAIVTKNNLYIVSD